MDRSALVLDRLLGLSLALVFLREGTRLRATTAALEFRERFEEDVVLRSLSVLDDAPGGLKLYDDLSHFFARSSLFAIEATSSAHLFDAIVSYTGVVFPVVPGFFGLEAGLSFLADVVLLLASPYVGLYYAHSLALRCHLRLSREMYLLFRGRWQDTAGDHSDNFMLEHVIVGVLLLTPLLFLLPTVLVYYAFWLLIVVCLKFTMLIVQVLALGAERFPLTQLWRRFRRPEQFQTGVFLEHEGLARGKNSGGAGPGPTAKPCYKPYLHLLFDAYRGPLRLLVSEVASDLGKGLQGKSLSPLFVKH
ncbi:hypothetical protein A3770_02p15770 [Chloropicon primus]|nr:hypothetical protein A3770_02p15770 [Chloropicon primus]|eukprot:QDZ19059.1 hypothetical protein A3770_02p15770 [Chloropicon primus]